MARRKTDAAQVLDRVEEVLDHVESNPYATAVQDPFVSDPFAAAVQDPFAAATRRPYTRDPFAAAVSLYVPVAAYVEHKKPKRRKPVASAPVVAPAPVAAVTAVTVPVPVVASAPAVAPAPVCSAPGCAKPAPSLRVPARRVVPPQARLLWMPPYVYEDCFRCEDDGFDPTEIWGYGAELDFTRAAELSYRDECIMACEDYFLYGQPIGALRETWRPCDCGLHDEQGPHADPVLWGAAMTAALQLRAELAATPQQLVETLCPISCRGLIADWGGLSRIPTTEEIAIAMGGDTGNGLAAAALDHAVWSHPGYYGPSGVKFEEALYEVLDEVNYPLAPVDNFLFEVRNLHPGTAPVAREWKDEPEYQIYGQYAADRIDYHSDLSGQVIGGWRSIYLQPLGRAIYPDVPGAVESPLQQRLW